MRLYGVGDVFLFGVREYSMRVWLDPERIATRGLTAEQVLEALRAQNVQVAGGALGEPPIDQANAFQVSLQMKGRLRDADEFEDIIVKIGADGRVVRRQGHRPRRARRPQLFGAAATPTAIPP